MIHFSLHFGIYRKYPAVKAIGRCGPLPPVRVRKEPASTRREGVLEVIALLRHSRHVIPINFSSFWLSTWTGGGRRV